MFCVFMLGSGHARQACQTDSTGLPGVLVGGGCQHVDPVAGVVYITPVVNVREGW